MLEMSASGGEEGSEEEIRVMSVKEVWYTNKAVLLAVALLVPVRITVGMHNAQCTMHNT